jgi:hypothetical protein
MLHDHFILQGCLHRQELVVQCNQSAMWTDLRHSQGGGLLRYITSSSPAGLVSAHLESAFLFFS